MSYVTTFSQDLVAPKSQIRARNNVLIQLWRFAVLNIKMIVMVTKGHH